MKELVAFANAGGGTLVFGVSDKESRASGIAPVPKAESCAERLKLVCRDAIEPTIQQLEMRGITTGENEEAGVIVFRVSGQSLMGPHRSKVDKEFYIRRNERSDPMTVDEIRRNSIDLQNRLLSIEKRFTAHSDKLFERVKSKSLGGTKSIYALTCHLIPIAPIQVTNLFPWMRSNFPIFNIDVHINKQRSGQTYMISNGLEWSPIVRGAQGVAHSPNGSALDATIKESGEIALALIETEASEVYLSWIVGMLANGILLADRVQRKARCNNIEYLISFSACSHSEKQLLLQGYSNSRPFGLGKVPNGSYTFPTLSLSSRRDYSDACAVLDRDFCDYAGYKGQHSETSFDFAPALQRIDTEFNSTT